jgi:hypothetical protein
MDSSELTGVIVSKESLLKKKVLSFYKDKENLNTFLSIILQKTRLSLRSIDWFVTNYSKKNYVVYMINKDNKMEKVNVYNDYKLKLKAYSKKKFDPFCRWDRINVPYKDDKFIQTTLGQLNFFKWTIENQILEYIETNYKIIENDMNLRNCCSKVKNSSINSTTSISSDESSGSYSSNTSTSTNNKTRKKREELSSNASRSINKEFIVTTVEFK